MTLIPIDRVAKSAVNYGLGIVLSVAMAGFLGVTVWRVMDYGQQREERLAGIIEDTIKHQTELLVAHDTRSVEAIQGIKVSNEQQRSRHEEIMRVLVRLVDRLDGVAVR